MTTITKKQNAVVATYDTHTQAEDSVKVLQKAGFEMKQVLIVGATTTPTNTSWAITMRGTA